MAEGFLSVLEGAARVFGDTSFFYAALSPPDPHHSRASEISQEILARGIEVVTSWEVIVECVTLLRYRLGCSTSQKFLVRVVPTLSVFYPGEADRLAAIEFYLKRSKGRRLSLCDAISYAVVSRRFSGCPCLSFDQDFAALGLLVIR